MRKTIWISVTLLLVLSGLGAGGWFWYTLIHKPAGSVATPSMDDTRTVPLGSSKNQELIPLTGSGSSDEQSYADKSLSEQSTSRPEFSVFDQYKAENDVRYQDINIGSGATVAPGQSVAVIYRGWLTSGKLFDENTSVVKPLSFQIGQHSVISGFEQGVVGMKVGGRRRLIIPPSLGYGDKSAGTIPAGSLLVFEVELLQAQ